MRARRRMGKPHPQQEQHSDGKTNGKGSIDSPPPLTARAVVWRQTLQMVWPWKLQSSHLDSSSIFQNVLSHSPVSSFFSLIQSATCIMRRGMSQSLHKDSTVSSSH